MVKGDGSKLATCLLILCRQPVTRVMVNRVNDVIVNLWVYLRLVFEDVRNFHDNFSVIIQQCYFP